MMGSPRHQHLLQVTLRRTVRSIQLRKVCKIPASNRNQDAAETLLKSDRTQTAVGD